MISDGQAERRYIAAVSITMLGVTAFAQATDVTGWQTLPWGASKAAAIKALQTLGLHECRQGAARRCEEKEELVIDNYKVAGVSYRIGLFFSPKSGFYKVRMTAADHVDSFRPTFADLTMRYGRPGMRSEYDGGRDSARTIWTWVKTHGAVSLEADDAEESEGVFTITYEAR